MIPLKRRVRIAQHLQKSWRSARADSGRDRRYAFARLEDCYRSFQESRASFETASARKLALAARRLHEALLARLNSVEQASCSVRIRLGAEPIVIPDIRDLAAELGELEAEFDELRVDWPNRVLSVTTKSVALRGIEFGPFAIQFFWLRLSRRMDEHCFEIVALEPNPAATNELVTHPHVKDQALCAGNAAAPLRTALEQGRLADTFFLVRSVLMHYNPDSPHVALEEWEGNDCYECGSWIGRDGSYYCESCGQDYCGDCITSCTGCEITRCCGCLVPCSGGGDYCSRSGSRVCAIAGSDCCPDCVQICSRCGREVSTQEIDSDTELCSSCQSEDSTEGTSSDQAIVDAESSANPVPKEEAHEKDSAAAASAIPAP